MKLYIANRSEIASRVIRSAKKLKIPTLVGYCEDDRELPFVREASKALLLKVDEPRDAYMNMEAVIAAAKEMGATHLHPGYGFLSEKAQFVSKLSEAGIKFVGPSSDAIEKLGDKIGSRLFLQKIGVPLLPSYEGEDKSEERLKSEAIKVGFPLLIKPSAGGGGKGMELVRAEGEFLEALGSSRRIAKSAFGDDRVFLERFIESARHVEVQILADESCEVVAVGERECSLQRRHQKVIEECPCAFLSDSLREQILEKSKEIARSVGYVSAGTVEWIWDGEDGVYFLEVNTRLQVEHPVTELVHGLDIVEWQLRIARGEKLTELPPSKPSGHAIELRICAEDPENDFLPTGGKIHRLELPESSRADFGYRQGNKVGSQFDSMLGKLIVHGEDRNSAIDLAIESLEQLILVGPKTNRSYLLQVLKQDAVRRGELSTNFLSQFKYHFDVTKALRAIKSLQAGEGSTVASGEDEDLDWYSPWGAIKRQSQSAFFEDHEGKRFYYFPFADWSERRDAAGGNRKNSSQSKSEDPDLRSPMPAKVTQILVSEGQMVESGAVTMVLEAMKMEHKIKAPFAGKVSVVAVDLNQQVDSDDLLISIQKEASIEGQSSNE